MLDSSSSARLDILDVIGSNLLYRPVSTLEACAGCAPLSNPPPPPSPPLAAARIYGVHCATTDIFPGMYFRTIRTENIVSRART